MDGIKAAFGKGMDEGIPKRKKDEDLTRDEVKRIKMAVFEVLDKTAKGGQSAGSGTFIDNLGDALEQFVRPDLRAYIQDYALGTGIFADDFIIGGEKDLLTKAEGGFIPAHQAGVLGLAEGGSITKTPEGQTRGFVQARSDGRRPGYTEDDEDTGGMGHHGGGHGIGVDTVSSDRNGADHSPKSTPTHTPDDSQDDDKAASYVNWNIQEKYTGDEDLEGQQEIDRRNAITRLKYDTNLTKDERHGLEVGLGLRQPKQATSVWKTIGKTAAIVSGVAPFLGFEAPAAVQSIAQLNSLHNKAESALKAYNMINNTNYTLEGLFNEVKNVETTDKKLLASLPDGHPEKIALEAKMNIKTTDDDGHGGDGTNIKIEEIETVNKTKAEKAQEEEYLKMQQAAYLYYLEQQKRRQAYLENYGQMFLANKGGLAGLFRVKNT
jgi:hypothetical protein